MLAPVLTLALISSGYASGRELRIPGKDGTVHLLAGGFQTLILAPHASIEALKSQLDAKSYQVHPINATTSELVANMPEAVAGLRLQASDQGLSVRIEARDHQKLMLSVIARAEVGPELVVKANRVLAHGDHRKAAALYSELAPNEAHQTWIRLGMADIQLATGSTAAACATYNNLELDESHRTTGLLGSLRAAILHCSEERPPYAALASRVRRVDLRAGTTLRDEFRTAMADVSSGREILPVLRELKCDRPKESFQELCVELAGRAALLGANEDATRVIYGYESLVLAYSEIGAVALRLVPVLLKLEAKDGAQRLVQAALFKDRSPAFLARRGPDRLRELFNSPQPPAPQSAVLTEVEARSRQIEQRAKLVATTLETHTSSTTQAQRGAHP